MVDRDAFKEIEEKAWTDMEVTGNQVQQMVIGGWWWWMVGGGGWLCLNPIQ